MKTNTLFLILVCLLTGFAPLQPAQAVVPPPDGGYPGFNTAEGQNALFSLTTGVVNTAVGWFSLFSDTDGSFNTGVGAGTLLFNVGNQSTSDGVNNTAIGAAALLLNNTGSDNTAVGTAALVNNDADANAAFGAFALNGNTTGIGNTAIGAIALESNTTGRENTASGQFALRANTIGELNTGVGSGALYSNTTGDDNTATGQVALFLNTTGNFNTAMGRAALQANTEGVSNTALGWGALLSNQTGSNNTAIGVRAGQNITGVSNICVGSLVSGVQGENNTIRIGDNLPSTEGSSACYIGGIYGQPASVGAQVLINSSGKLGTILSSRRFKKDIKPMDSASEVIHALKPVTFHYKSDNTDTRQFGLIAEEVSEANPDLVVRDENGQIYTVRYEQINAMLLNEFLREHKTVQEQGATITQQRKDFEAALAKQQKQIEALTASLQRVSAQIEASTSASKIVLNRN